MSSRSLNKVQLIGNLTRDPELRYTPTGAAVCTIGLATNRTWVTESGEKKEESEFHRVVAWNKLAELCSQLLTKGRKIYVEGRLRTNSWQTQDGTQRSTTEIIIEDMIILDSKRPVVPGHEDAGRDVVSEKPVVVPASVDTTPDTVQSVEVKEVKADQPEKPSEDVNPDDIPF